MKFLLGPGLARSSFGAYLRRVHPVSPAGYHGQP